MLALAHFGAKQQDHHNYTVNREVLVIMPAKLLIDREYHTVVMVIEIDAVGLKYRHLIQKQSVC